MSAEVTNQWWSSSDQSPSRPDPSEEFKTTCLAQVLTCYTYVDSPSLAHTLTHVTANVQVCDTRYIPSINLYACIYRLIVFIHIYCTSWGQVHIQQNATIISYTDISLCTGIHKNGSILLRKAIKIYAPNSHYHQISRRKGLWQLPSPYPFACMHMRQKQIVERRKGGGCLGGVST